MSGNPHLAAASRPVGPFKAPPLLWPLAVVLAPLLLLGALAAWTLNSDRRSARQEAKARADEIASAVMSSAEDDLKIVKFQSEGFYVTNGQNIITVNRNHELIGATTLGLAAATGAADGERFQQFKIQQAGSMERGGKSIWLR